MIVYVLAVAWGTSLLSCVLAAVSLGGTPVLPPGARARRAALQRRWPKP